MRVYVCGLAAEMSLLYSVKDDFIWTRYDRDSFELWSPTALSPAFSLVNGVRCSSALPASFYEKSSLYPLPKDATYKKNNHASAWHMDLNQDLRSLIDHAVALRPA